MNKIPRFLVTAALAVLLAAISVGLLVGSPSATPVSAQAEPSVIPLGPKVLHIDPYPWGLMYRHAAEEAHLPSVIELTINIDNTITTTTSLSDQITDAGGRHISGDSWRVPLAALTPVVQRADVTTVRMIPGARGTAHIPAYDRMSGSLQGVVESYRETVDATEAANMAFIAKSGKVAVIIDATSAAQERQIRAWLTRNSITPIGPVAGADTSENVVAAMVPVGKNDRFHLSKHTSRYIAGPAYLTAAGPRTSRVPPEHDQLTAFLTGSVGPP